MLQRFTAKKNKILRELSRSEEEYTDLSPKGSVDEGIRDLVTDINNLEGFVTTSSCAGRAVVYLEGPPKQQINAETTNETETGASVQTSAKGGGRWLFTSHEPVDVEALWRSGALFSELGFSANADVSIPPTDGVPQLLHFKFEPMILHILTASPSHAQAALRAAMTAGFRESGISGIEDKLGRATPPMLAVRTSGIALDSIVGFQSDQPGAEQMIPVVSAGYLRAILQLANARFRENSDRTWRFHQALLREANANSADRPASSGVGQEWESYAARAERKRRENLSKKEQQVGAGSQSPDENYRPTESLEEEALGFELLTER